MARYTKRFKTKVLNALATGMSKTQAERQFKVSYATITKWQRADTPTAVIEQLTRTPDTEKLMQVLAENARLYSVIGKLTMQAGLIH